MSSSLDRLYQKLPVIHRLRDHEQGEPLRALLQVIAEQVDLVEEDVRQLYENWFIETCQDWVVPYIGDLVGYRIVHEAGEPGEGTTPQGRTRNKILIPRREVANTVRYRRRKGMLALLEELARDVTGWPSRAVEFYALLAQAQALNHLRSKRGRTVDLREGDALARLGGPFDTLAHSVDVRPIGTDRPPQGRYNIPNVGLYVWRLRSYRVTRTQAYKMEGVGPHCYTFSALGNNLPLYVRPEPEPSPAHIAGELNVPVPIRRQAFRVRPPQEEGAAFEQASPAYYGRDKSLAIWARDWPEEGAVQPIPRQRIIPADLSVWDYRPPRDHVAVDPALGRILFPPSQLPHTDVDVEVTYHYGFSAEIGGGEYERTLRQPDEAVVFRVGEGYLPSLTAALARWDAGDPDNAVIEIVESGVREERIAIPDQKRRSGFRPIELRAGQSLQLRAASGTRPILRLPDYRAAGLDSLIVLLSRGSRFALDGLLIAGRGVHVGPAPTQKDDDEAQPPPTPCDDPRPRLPAARLEIRHCTLVPGWSLENDCEPRWPAKPSLEIWGVEAQVTVEQSILGSIQVHLDAVAFDPILIRIRDSILDATGSDCDDPACEALGAPGSAIAHAVLTVARCTVFGKVMTHAIELAEDTIFDGQVQVARSQRGCMRFCYVRPGSYTPRRYHCQPDLVERPILQGFMENKIDRAERDRRLAEVRLQVRPQFNSRRYGTPTYCQLAHTCSEAIVRGASDESEMGVFHDLYQPQREANLRTRLAEYSPAGMDAGIIYVS